MINPLSFALTLLLFVSLPLFLHSQTTPPPPPSSSPISNDRILGIIPNFQTVSDPNSPYTPLRVRDKWHLFVKESIDPFQFATAAAGAGLSQIGDNNPKYGIGGMPYLQRFGAALADLTTQNFFSDAVLASVLREDPRYFRMGPGASVPKRIVYALTRIVVTRRDSGRDSFNFSGVVGMGMGIGLSDAYYPPKSRGGGELESRLITSFTGAALGNLLPEFWPDVRQKLARLRLKRHSTPQPGTSPTGN